MNRCVLIYFHSEKFLGNDFSGKVKVKSLIRFFTRMRSEEVFFK